MDMQKVETEYGKTGLENALTKLEIDMAAGPSRRRSQEQCPSISK